MRPVDQAIPGKLKDLLSGAYLKNPVDDGVTERINNKLVDKILWEEAKKGKEDGKGTGSFSIGPNQNSELHFAVNARYICPYSVMGYAVSWVYRLVETGHDWESVKAGKETACNFSLHVSDITARRMTPGTEDKNQFARRHSVPVRVVRGDGWKLFGNETENPTFNAAPIELDEHFQWPEIYKAFYNLTNMAHIARLHARCEHMKIFNSTPCAPAYCV
ncbi:hypothetical protein PRIPAC_95472 [Pristionchus pacificus]|uniref:Uncharacterized protein n=1 Tax=Pristionchus pacificus TaxID=54126 RepID=A0A2A6BJS7_PRIPA|nr:hypothetical protein PRIPAC_95472 [Pristionchus pacificus]|eukprot:PDM66149.1 hypothetical protein PRIPAC_45374 [Pristionchus pacificus]